MKRFYLSLLFSMASVAVMAAGGSIADKPQGFRFFNRHLTIKPYVSLSYSYDSNVDTDKSEEADSIFLVSPGVDFEWNGNIDSAAAGSLAHDVCIAKSGPGTMRLNGQIKYTYRPTRISAGTLLLGKTDAVVAGASFLMEGGTLSLADGTANTCKSIEVLADSTIDFGSDATLTIDTLTVAEGATLTLTGDAAKKLKVNVSLDGAGIVMLNGKRISRMADGYLGTLGLIITLM
jgi:autotransporter-associated beta strand protein